MTLCSLSNNIIEFRLMWWRFLTDCRYINLFPKAARNLIYLLLFVEKHLHALMIGVVIICLSAEHVTQQHNNWPVYDYDQKSIVTVQLEQQLDSNGLHKPIVSHAWTTKVAHMRNCSVCITCPNLPCHDNNKLVMALVPMCCSDNSFCEAALQVIQCFQLHLIKPVLCAWFVICALAYSEEQKHSVLLFCFKTHFQLPHLE